METIVQPCDNALSVRNVTKTFASGSDVSLLERMRRRVKRSDKAGNRNGAAHAEINGDPAESARKRVLAVDGVSLEVCRNEIFGILGPNGSGKSTLIRLMATLLLPDSGAIEVFGLDVTRDEMQVKRLINRVSVDAAFFKKLSSIENLMYAGRLYGLTGREAREQSFVILRRLGLKDKEITGPLED
ncbi:MAG TPA: ATP-binding cassette domain-containing protein, partial [Anaerolineae bacterium]|nr:ATP-binding cassette domain-containing protein [Anaerolineae bacterium]